MHLVISTMMWFEKVWGGSMHLNHPELVHTHLASPVKIKFGTVEPPQTHVKELYTPCYPCDDMVRKGQKRFDALESPWTLFPVKMWFDKVRYDRTTRTQVKDSIHLVISTMMWFEKVRGGSIHLIHPDLVHNHPAHLISPVKSLRRIGIIEPPQTHVKELYTLLSLLLCGSRGFEEVHCTWTTPN